MENKLKKLYLGDKKLKAIYKIITKHPDYILYKAVSVNLKYKRAKEKNNKFKILYYGLTVNRMASKYNLELYGKYGDGLKIWHGNIIINNNANLGDNVQLHGNNCIGQKNGKAPTIGNNVDIGYGATIIGDIKIANNITIGANSLVNKEFLEEGVIIAGCPAKIIKRK